MERLLLTLIIIILVVVGASLAELRGLEVTSPAYQAAPGAAGRDDSGWRRTQFGWEHESTWRDAEVTSWPWAARISPLVIGALQLLLAIGALVLFSERSNRPIASVDRRPVFTGPHSAQRSLKPL